MKSLHKILFLIPFAVSGAQGAVTAITAATYTPAGSMGSPQVLGITSSVASVTTSEGTFSNLVGATSASASGQRIWKGTDPGDDSNTLVGLVATDGLLNLTSPNTDIQLGGGFDAATRFFILEVAGAGSSPGDSMTLTLIDSIGTTLDLSLSLTGSQFGSALARFEAAREGNDNITLDQGGLTFALSDFTGTGSAATATGFRITSANTFDPAVFGTFTVPEPASALLVGLALPALLLRRRR